MEATETKHVDTPPVPCRAGWEEFDPDAITLDVAIAPPPFHDLVLFRVTGIPRANSLPGLGWKISLTVPDECPGCGRPMCNPGEEHGRESLPVVELSPGFTGAPMDTAWFLAEDAASGSWAPVSGTTGTPEERISRLRELTEALKTALRDYRSYKRQKLYCGR